MDPGVMEEAAALANTEALKRVGDEDLDVMAETIERMPDATGEEVARVLQEEHPAVWRRYDELYREAAEDLARGL
jgi:hypothetical protein